MDIQARRIQWPSINRAKPVWKRNRDLCADDKAEKRFVQVDDIPFVTVIVPMYNEKGYIAKCLDSLVVQDYPQDRFEVLVVDGFSDDGSRELAQDWSQNHSQIRVLDNPRRITAAALNIGIQNARGQVIIAFSAHGSAASNFISQNVFHLTKTGAACVGGPIQTYQQSVVGKAIALAMSSPFGVGNALFRYSDKEQYVDTVAFGAYHRQVFDEIGFFDEELVYNEDDEFSYRLREYGGRIWLTPDIQSCYYARASFKGLVQQYYRYGLGKVRVIKRHPQASSMRPYVPFALVTTLLVTGMTSLLNPVFLLLFLCVLSSYLAASLLVTLAICARSGWRYLPLLPVAFACLHFAYGFGFLIGALKSLQGSQRRPYGPTDQSASST
jgi:GT2 family glycosyltransferase